MLWQEQSWPAIQALPKNLPVVVPLGSIEQHGRHLPVAVDTLQVAEIASRAEQALGKEALFLPPLWLGCSEHHLDFPGTISLAPSLYSQTIQAIALSILRAGFKRILFLNGHGGNETPAAQALTELVGRSDVADSAHLAFSSWWQIGREALVPGRHGMATPSISHACEYETSLMLAIRPDLVHLPDAQILPPALATSWYHSEYGGRVRLFHRFHRLTGSGSMGNPAAASAGKGASLLEAVTADVVALIGDLAAWPLFESRVPPAQS